MIDPFSLGLLILGAMLFAVIIGIPIPIAMISSALIGMTLVEDFDFAGTQLNMVAWEIGSGYLVLNLPLFLLMGQLAYRSGFAADLFAVMYRWVGRLPGGINLSTVYAATGFGAITGSSLATVSTIGQVAMPEVKRYGYDEGFAAGCVASASVIAILIPPSLPMVFYGIWSETSIGALFMAGVLPGLILAFAFSTYISIRCWLNPALGPPVDSSTINERIAILPKLLPTLIIIVIVFGGIYSGSFSPTESAAAGISAILLMALIMGRVQWGWIKQALTETGRLCTTMFMVFVGGMLISRFLVQVEFTEAIIQQVNSIFTSPVSFLLALMVMYVILGAILDSYGMLVLTLPFVLPAVNTMGIDTIVFGVFLTLMIEISLITPPIGLNVFIMQKVTPDIPLWSMFKGCFPFVMLSVLAVLLIVLFPEVVLLLPNLLAL